MSHIVAQQHCFSLRTPVSYSDLNLLPVLSAAAVQNMFSRAFLMLMVWIKVHPGDPYAVSQACETGDIGDTNETVHSCPCVNDGDFVKAIRDPSGAPEPVFSLFKLLNKDTGIHENTLLEMLLGLETSLSKRDVGEAFSLIDTQRKGFLTEYDLKLVFGSEFQGKPMRELITDLHSNNCNCGKTDDGDTIGEDTISDALSTITYKQLQQHLRLSSENRWVTCAITWALTCVVIAENERRQPNHKPKCDQAEAQYHRHEMLQWWGRWCFPTIDFALRQWHPWNSDTLMIFLC